MGIRFLVNSWIHTMNTFSVSSIQIFLVYGARWVLSYATQLFYLFISHARFFMPVIVDSTKANSLSRALDLSPFVIHFRIVVQVSKKTTFHFALFLPLFISRGYVISLSRLVICIDQTRRKKAILCSLQINFFYPFLKSKSETSRQLSHKQKTNSTS